MSDTFAPTLAQLDRLLKAFNAITPREFAASLRESIGAGEDYARGVWPAFAEHPFAYCCSRNPREQGEALLALALEKLRLADATGRAIGCPGAGRCHDRSIHCSTCGKVKTTCHDREHCAVHHLPTDEEVREYMTGMFKPAVGSTERRRVSRTHLVESAVSYFGMFAEIDPAQVVRVLDATMAAGEIQVVNRQGWPGGWLEAPLPPQKPGEHSAQCPVNAEYWRGDPECDSDVCAFVPAETVADKE